MAGDYTRFSFKANNNYAQVRQQQGRVSVDADWNEADAIADRRWRSETHDILGRCVVPATTPEAFEILPTGPGTFDIGVGRLYLDGLQAENHGLTPLFDPLLAEPHGTRPVPYSALPGQPAQPFYPTAPALTAPVTGRHDLVYLHVWRREVTALEDPGLLDVALGGPDTTTRVQTAWQVQVLEDVGDIHCADELPAWDALVAPSAGRLSSEGVAPGDDKPCVISPVGGYRGVENRLYRVEIHTPGAVGTAKFKWSRDNASVSAVVEEIAPGLDRVTVRELGRDQVLRFNVGDWIEVLDDPLEFRVRAGENVGGHMAEITAIDEANRILTLSPAIDGTLGFDAGDPHRHTRIRRWDQRNDVDANGLINTTAGLYELEDGVRVAFSIDPANPSGGFKRGDHWLITARTADGSVETLVAAPPRGVHHHYCRLAVVHWGADAAASLVQDCRTIWPPARCCTISVRPGENIQAAIDGLPAEGGCVCLLPGVHRIHEPLLIDGRRNILLKGTGAASKLIYRHHEPEHTYHAAVYVAGGSRDIRVAEMLIHSQQLPWLIVIDEAAQSVEIADCQLINAGTKDASCVLLGECRDVQLRDNRMLAEQDIAQAMAKQLADVEADLAALRPPAEGGGTEEAAATDEESAPRRIQPLRELRVLGNTLCFLNAGVFLVDALNGAVNHNRLQMVGEDDLKSFRRKYMPHPGRDVLSELDGDLRRELEEAGRRDRADVSDVRAATEARAPDAIGLSEARPAPTPDPDAFYETLDDRLARLPGCGALAEPAEEQDAGGEEFHIEPTGRKSPGILAGLIQDYEIRHNRMVAGIGMQLLAGRDVATGNNHILADSAGVMLGYAFDCEVRDSDLRIVGEDSDLDTMPQDAFRAWRQRHEPGRAAVSLFFVRGVKVRNNRIHAETGVAADRTTKAPIDAGEVSRESMLRVLGLQRLWQVLVEMAWFFYLVFMLLSEKEEEAPPEGSSRKEQFEQRLYDALAKMLDGRLFRHFVGKAEISDNQMQVGRYGVLLHDILTIGGLRILRNRISGHAWAGIHVHHWHSVGHVDRYAGGVRCAIQWLLAILTLLRDRLEDFLTGGSDDAAGDNGLLGWVTVGISWLLVLCGRLCGGGETTGEDGGTGETPPSPVEALKDALDDFLDGVDPSWIDDLVNQSHVIDGNVVAGAGDGIYTGLDGSVIRHNRVTVWPRNQVPYEMVLFGLGLNHHFRNQDLGFYSDEMAILAEAAIDADRDALFVMVAATNVADWVDEHFAAPEFRATLRTAVAGWAGHVSTGSPLASHVQAMWQGLDEANLDQAMVSTAWRAVLIVMIRELRGYGILLRGGDMHCHHNQVEARGGCGGGTLGGLLWGTRTLNTTSERAEYHHAAAITRKPNTVSLFGVPGLGGIWQLSTSSSLFVDGLFLFGEKIVNPSAYHQVLYLIASWIHYTGVKRSLRICDNTVETALLNGIRSLNIQGSDETEIVDNQVRDAGRDGLRHHTAPLVGLQGRITLKVRGNTVLQAQNSSAFRAISDLPEHFSALMRLMNGDIENDSVFGTILLANNHCDGREPQNDGSAAIHVMSRVVGVSDNHVLCAANYAFNILAVQGLFTDNIADRSNQISDPAIEKDPNLQI